MDERTSEIKGTSKIKKWTRVYVNFMKEEFLYKLITAINLGQKVNVKYKRKNEIK